MTSSGPVPRPSGQRFSKWRSPSRTASLKKATAGQHVLAVALQDAASGKPCEVFITRTVIPATASSLALSLKDLTDVDSNLAPTADQILKYDNTDHVFKAAADAT